MRIAAIAPLLPFVAIAMTRFSPLQLPASEWPDTEVSTNMVFNAGSATENEFALTIGLDAATSNNVEVAFGIDVDEDGILDFEEREFVVGWDCGAWFYRDLRSDVSETAAFADGRRELRWTLCLNGNTRVARQLAAADGGFSIPFSVAPTFFNPAWNVARVTVRGKGAALECIAAKLSSVGFTVRIR